MASEDSLMHKLHDLQKQISKKQRFEEAVCSIAAMLRESYPSAPPSLQKSFFSVISRVATILKTRYTAPGFWQAGLRLFEQAELLVSDPSEKEHIRSCIAGAREQLYVLVDRDDVLGSAQNRPNQGYLFDGHLTVDPEPPQPNWLMQQNMLSTVGTLLTAESSNGHEDASNPSERITRLIEEMLVPYNDIIPEILGDDVAVQRVPPASKEVVAKLPVTVLTEEVVNKIGKETECAICKESFGAGDSMQELPCKHTFHPPCLKPWLDEHNSCPICRHELRTDDHAYESKKEREKEAEEERKGAANAVRGGEFMYV